MNVNDIVVRSILDIIRIHWIGILALQKNIVSPSENKDRLTNDLKLQNVRITKENLNIYIINKSYTLVAKN